MKKNKYVYKRRKQPFFKLIGCILRLFIKKPKKIINYNESIDEKAIFLSTHCGKNGPYCLSQYLPYKHATWGASEMLGKYRVRRRYLKDVLYVQKLHKKKFPSAIKATILAFFNPFIYKGMSVIPTHQDINFVTTLNNSINTLNNNYPILIFPEDSTDGYKEILEKLLPGFIILSERYYKKEKIDLPIYPIYYHYKKRVILIGKPLYIQKLKSDNKTNDEICEIFKNEINNLYFNYIGEGEK